MLEITLNASNDDKFKDEAESSINSINDALAALLGATSKFIIEHDDYLLDDKTGKIKDVSILKKEMKNKIKRVV